MEYSLIKSKRKTAAIEIKAGEVIIRVPEYYTEAMLQSLIQHHIGWIEEKLEKSKLNQRNKVEIGEKERTEGIKNASRLIAERVAYYSKIMDVDYGRITIRQQKTRWGSCSARGNLNFNWRLILAPAFVLDYVVVHELAHRRYMNHSKQFYLFIETILPDYRTAVKWLKEYGNLIIG